MSMKQLIYLYLIFSFVTLSEERGVKVQIIDQNIDSSSLEQRYQVSRKGVSPPTLPDKMERDQALASISAINSWDELKKDIFYVDMKHKSIDELMVKYPELSKKDIIHLKGNK